MGMKISNSACWLYLRVIFERKGNEIGYLRSFNFVCNVLVPENKSTENMVAC